MSSKTTNPKVIMMVAASIGIGSVIMIILLPFFSPYRASVTISWLTQEQILGEGKRTTVVTQQANGRQLLRLPTLTTSLGGKGHHQLTMVLVADVAGETKPSRLDERFPYLRHEILRLLEKSETQDVGSPAGKQWLLDELKTELNRALGAPLVSQVYYDTFLVQ